MSWGEVPVDAGSTVWHLRDRREITGSLTGFIHSLLFYNLTNNTGPLVIPVVYLVPYCFIVQFEPSVLNSPVLT